MAAHGALVGMNVNNIADYCFHGSFGPIADNAQEFRACRNERQSAFGFK